MLHVKFQNHRTPVHEKIILKEVFFSIYWHGGHLGHVT